METFVKNEAGYAAWIVENPRGYIVNIDHAMTVPQYPMVHVVDHKLVTDGDAFTTGDYYKVCSTDFDELQDWSQDKAGRQLTWCKVCLTKARAREARTNDHCDVLTPDGWKTVSVMEALDLSGTKVRCQECKGAVRLHRAGPNGVPRAHAEHLVAHPGCSLGSNFSGARSEHPSPVQSESNDRPWTDEEVATKRIRSRFPHISRFLAPSSDSFAFRALILPRILRAFPEPTMPSRRESDVASRAAVNSLQSFSTICAGVIPLSTPTNDVNAHRAPRSFTASS